VEKAIWSAQTRYGT